MSLEAQMNVDADRLAGAYNEFESKDTIVPMLPVTGVHLQIHQHTITGRYSRHIRNAAGEGAYLEYLSRTNHWDDNTWDCIDRTVLRRLIARHSHNYVNVVKMIHDYLPTSKIRAYSDSTVTNHCELCHAVNSTFTHVLLCPHPTRSSWRSALLQAVRTQCELSTTRLGIMQAIIAGLKAWFTDTHLDVSPFPLEIQRAIQAQTRIGWRGFLRGFCSSRWVKLQHAHLQHNDLVTTTVTGAAWLVSLVTTIWKHIFHLWDSYTIMLHGADKQATSHQALRRICTKIRLLHSRAAHIRAADQCWLIPNLEAYLHNSTASQLHRWYSTYEPVIIEAIKIARDASVANTRSIRSYFPTTRAPRRPIQHAARLQHRTVTVNPARNQAKSRQHTPRPRSIPTVRRYYKPVSCDQVRPRTTATIFADPSGADPTT